MDIILHRVNQRERLKTLPLGFGVEIDIRSRGGKLILTHDPSKSGESLEGFLKEFARLQIRGPLVLNVKEDGHEPVILSLVKKFHIKNYFYLDQPIPTLVRLAVQQRIRHIAVRVSEYETCDSALKFKNLVDWVWIDCFSGQPPTQDVLRILKRYFRICLVSPELQKYPPETIRDFKTLHPQIDAVCTKFPELWGVQAS
jgi:hypothetical protein